MWHFVYVCTRWNEKPFSYAACCRQVMFALCVHDLHLILFSFNNSVCKSEKGRLEFTSLSSSFSDQAGKLVKLAAVKEFKWYDWQCTICFYTCCNYHESVQQRNFHIWCATWFCIINFQFYWYWHEWQCFKQTKKATSAADKSIIHFEVKLWQMSAIPRGLIQLLCLSHATLTETASKSHSL